MQAYNIYVHVLDLKASTDSRNVICYLDQYWFKIHKNSSLVDFTTGRIVSILILYLILAGRKITVNVAFVESYVFEYFVISP